MSEEFYNVSVAGDLDEIREMLARDPSLVHAKDKWGFTALHGVAGEDLIEVATCLLDQGANPNAKNDDGITPLHLAAYPSMVELLVKRGAEIDSRSNDGSTPLLTQAAEAEGIDVMRTLLELGEDPKAKDRAGYTAADIARSRQEDEKLEPLGEGGSGAGKKWWKFW